MSIATDATEASSPQGRPRNNEVDAKIEKAASALLAETGYSGFSIERLAQNAGVSKASIYRRWNSKGELLLGLYVHDIVEPVPSPPGDDVFDALEEYLQLSVMRLTSQSWKNALRTIVAEAQTDPKLAELLRLRLVFPRRQAARSVLERGMADGQISDRIDMEMALDLLFGPLWYRLLFEHLEFDRAFVSALITELRRYLSAVD